MAWKAPILLLFLYISVAHAECPINLDYVTQMSWNSSYCQSIQTSAQLENCRTTLRTVIGVGLAQFLRDQSIFELPNYASAIACFSRFQQKLTSMGLPQNLVQLCFNDTSDYVSSPHLCGGIKTKQDWVKLLGPTSLDTACKGDLSGVPACGACYASGEAVHRQLTDMIKNISKKTSRKCYYFICLYAAGVANELGPMTTQAASCILRVPFLQRKPKRRILFYGFTGAAIGFLLLSGLGLGYCLWVRMKGKAKHRYFVRNNRSLLKDTVKPNMGAVWFNIHRIKAATANFSDANVVGQGSFGTVYKGVLTDGRPIAVKRITNCNSEGETEFINEVEIINSIRHRNLVAMRGFCVSSDDKKGRQRFLIYDFMANGSLDEHIFGGNRGTLSWEQRKNIALGTAKGLCYLHYGVQPAIYHRDIKATNILLDDEMNACVADFGLARITTRAITSHHKNRWYPWLLSP
ncbi:hypothetical protein SUGI_0476590 [Cryptomeria japonica]|nr:hypothetical protein SUGI_0476590 [Cryptomeria japonica]